MFKASKKLTQISTRSLLIAAISLHLFVSIGTYFLAKARLFPALQSDGVILAVTPDGIDNICFAEQLAREIRAGNVRALTDPRTSLHVKIYSLSFVVLSPLVGMSVLAGEPINLLLYIAILSLVFKIGSTVFNREVGLVSSIVVAIWPSFLLHTTQLVKDQFFVAALLLIVLIMVHWLTRPKPSFPTVALMIVAGAGGAYVIVSTRTQYWALLIIVFVALGLVLLLARQLIERQLLVGHMLTALPIIVVSIAVYLTTPTTSMRVVPHRFNPPTVARSRQDPPEPASSMTLKRRIDLMAVRIWQFRFDYERAERGAGTIDNGVVFADAKQLLAYLPRAAVIGLFAPFPNQWFDEGRQSGKIGRRVAAAEMLVAYVFFVFATVGFWNCRKHLASWLLLLIGLLGVTTLALIVPNLGAMFRMRYSFFIILIPVAISGALRLVDIIQTQPQLHNRNASAGAN